MSKKKQKRETAEAQRSKSDGRIPSPPPVDDEELVFSFKDLDFSSDKYSIAKLTADEVELLFTRMREHCQNPFREFINPPGNPKAIRSHLIRFGSTSDREGFAHILHDRWKERPWQFQLARTKGRVLGYLLRSKFYVVWIDRDHLLFS